MCRNVWSLLGISFVSGIIWPEKCLKLAQTFARKIGKPCLISMSQKSILLLIFFVIILHDLHVRLDTKTTSCSLWELPFSPPSKSLARPWGWSWFSRSSLASFPLLTLACEDGGISQQHGTQQQHERQQHSLQRYDSQKYEFKDFWRTSFIGCYSDHGLSSSSE